jgi:hypothetical protein
LLELYSQRPEQDRQALKPTLLRCGDWPLKWLSGVRLYKDTRFLRLVAASVSTRLRARMRQTPVTCPIVFLKTPTWHDPLKQ